MIFKEEKVNKWYRKIWFPWWLEIKKNHIFWRFPISFGLFFDENNIVKLVIGHAVCEGIAASYGQLLLKQIKIIIIFPLILLLFATHRANRNQVFFYLWTRFIRGFRTWWISWIGQQFLYQRKVLTFSKFVCSLQTQILFVITIFNWLNCSQVPPF